MRKFILILIRCYQKFISPHKGYSCAYGALHKNGTCSSRVFSIVQNSPSNEVIREISAQFKACKDAHIQLCAEKKDKDKDKEKNNDCLIVTGECGLSACLSSLS